MAGKGCHNHSCVVTGWEPLCFQQHADNHVQWPDHVNAVVALAAAVAVSDTDFLVTRLQAFGAG